MNNTEMHLLFAVLVLALLSVGAYLLSRGGDTGQFAGPDPSTLPATPASPATPPAAVHNDANAYSTVYEEEPF